ncbi:hypothetical protein Gotur_032697 [Gossypium turneri]
MGNGSRDDIDERSKTLPFLEQKSNETIPSTTRNSHGQPIGLEARLLAGYLGIMSLNVNLLLTNYESWHHMSDGNKNQALDNIKVSDNYVKKALENKWRDHKSTLKKKYFKKNISLEEKLRNVSPEMLRTTSRQKKIHAHSWVEKFCLCS